MSLLLNARRRGLIPIKFYRIIHVACERAASPGRVGTRIKGSRKGRRRKRGGKRPNSFLSVVRFNFPRFASEPFNALQPAPLPTHFLVPFPPFPRRSKGPRCRSRIYEEIDRASIRSIPQPTIVSRESCRNEASETRLLLSAASIYVVRG